MPDASFNNCDKYFARRRVIDAIEACVYEGLGLRGLAGLEIHGAYEMASKALLESNCVLILTGFPVRGATLGETDGPPGALLLGRALEHIGKRVFFATDYFSAPLLKIGFGRLNMLSQVHTFGIEARKGELRALFDTLKPDLVMSIERPGRALDGQCYSMRGESISDLAPSLDPFFEFAKSSGIPTLSIGDGGNEIGMGALHSAIAVAVNKGELIAATTPADHLMLASVSNWGAQALAGILSVDQGRDLLISSEETLALIVEMVEIGAVDGATKRSEPTVDGYSMTENMRMLETIKQLVLEYLDTL